MYGENEVMDVKIEYESGAGAAHRRFKLEITNLAHGGCSGPEMAEKIVASLVSGDAQWIVDVGDAHQVSPPALEK